MRDIRYVIEDVLELNSILNKQMGRAFGVYSVPGTRMLDGQAVREHGPWSLEQMEVNFPRHECTEVREKNPSGPGEQKTGACTFNIMRSRRIPQTNEFRIGTTADRLSAVKRCCPFMENANCVFIYGGHFDVAVVSASFIWYHDSKWQSILW